MFNLAEQRRSSSVGLFLGALLGAASQVSAAPLFGVPNDSLLVPSPTAYQHAEPTANSLTERELAKAATDPRLFQWKREPSLKFAEEAHAKLALMKRSPPKQLKKRGKSSSKCVPKGSDQEDISQLFAQGGAGTQVALCPSTTYELTDVVYFTAANQVLYTLGYPTDDTRAVLKVTGSDQSVAVWAGCNECNGVQIRNVEIDGNRPGLGRLESGAALIETGGAAGGQTIAYSHIHDPRGWSAMHIAEGPNNACSGFSALGNDIGPSGESPNSAYQFHTQLQNFKSFLADPSARLTKRDDSDDDSVIAPGQWADGISLSCADSTIRGNTITDTTDGGIVIFGSPGSLIRGNTIVSKTQVGLGGINLVDWNPWNGNYDEVTVSGNVLSTEGAMIKIGIAMGPLVWGSYNNSEYYNIGASVKNNNFISDKGYFGYGVATAAHTSAVTSSNRFSNARFNLAPTYACFQDYMPPAAGPMVRDPYTTQGQFQRSTSEETLLFLICIMPCEYSDDGCTWDNDSSSQSKLSVVSSADESNVVEAALNLIDGENKVAEFIDDRPPYTYDSDKALSKNDSGAIAHEDEPFQITSTKVAVLQARRNAEKAAEAALLSKRDGSLNKRQEMERRAEQMVPGYGRNVYEKRDLESQFLAI